MAGLPLFLRTEDIVVIGRSWGGTSLDCRWSAVGFRTGADRLRGALRGEKLGLYARFQSSLPQRLSELCILIMASHWTASGEWIDHEPIARSLGVDAEALENLRKGLPAAFEQPDEAVVYQFAQELLNSRPLPWRRGRA